MNKKLARLRRSRKARSRIKKQAVTRLCVHRTPKHIYAQVFSNEGDKTLVSASTVEESFKTKKTGNQEAAAEVGRMIAERALKMGIKQVAFDRSGFKYHGRIKALADKAREIGLEF
jgi:large subunit ribosomal protein L18